ncbi:MAG: hypothetical protein JWO92_1122 [Chitinophagaceae bacterium]|nr:hypothetical protein [Chitinophagaceae bacterium]
MTSGGFRKNARRPYKYGEPTIPIQKRVPISKKKKFNKQVDEILKQWEAPKKKPRK